MSNLFRRAAVFTDIHFGMKSNSKLHNQDCLDFVNWAIETARANDCDVGMFLGDWHHHRAVINIQTLSYSLQALEQLSNNFDRFYFIPGNHDLYYRDKRDIHGTEWAKHIPNITIVNDWFQEGNVVIAPWLVGDDYKKIPKLKGQYMFGHFELPHFYMNAMVQMPDHGEIKSDDFRGFDKVFSGHFHKRQQQGNINYIGNCFPHNYADASDDARGLMILEWGQEPKFIAWPGQPRYRVYNLSKIIDNPEKWLEQGMHVRVNLDIDISYEEANFIKETFVNSYGLRELSLIPQKDLSGEQEITPGSVEFQSVDTIVTNNLTNIDSDKYDVKLLLEIYNNL